MELLIHLVTLENVAVAVTLLAVYLTVRQIVWCWPLGIVSVTMYAWIFRDARLYADMGLQVLYLTMSIYGWWAWLHGGERGGELAVSRTRVRVRWLLLGAGAAGGLGLGLGLERWTDAALPFMDSLLTSFSLVGQWMQTRKLLEAWLVWLAVDVFYVGMFVYKGLYPTAGLYFVFLVLAARGFAEWRASMPEPAPA